MRTTIAKTLMKRDGITEDEANEIVRDLKREFETLVDNECLTQAMDIMYQVGLEPDYLDELVNSWAQMIDSTIKLELERDKTPNRKGNIHAK